MAACDAPWAADDRAILVRLDQAGCLQLPPRRGYLFTVLRRCFNRPVAVVAVPLIGQDELPISVSPAFTQAVSLPAAAIVAARMYAGRCVGQAVEGEPVGVIYGERQIAAAVAMASIVCAGRLSMALALPAGWIVPPRPAAEPR